MVKLLVLVGLGLGMAACASDDGGGAGSGNDTLPKRGEKATDPTIVGATAYCSKCGSQVCPIDPANPEHLVVWVSGSDMGGAENIGTCVGTLGSETDQDSYSSSYSSCVLNFFDTPCVAASTVTVGLTVSNDTGGVTTASVKLNVSAE